MTASLSTVVMFASARAGAELTSAKARPRAFIHLWNNESDAPRLNLVSIPSFTFSPIRVPWIGMWGGGSVQWPLAVAPLAMEQPDYGSSFCLSSRCSFPRTEGLDSDPLTAAPNASRRAIEGIGPIAAAALALFSSPKMKKEQPLVMRISPMFALGGAGLELRGSWW